MATGAALARARLTRSATSSVFRRVRSVLPGRDTPLTMTVLILYGLTTIALRVGAPADNDVLQWASTNLVNLNQHPVTAMLASILVSSSGLSVQPVVYAVGSAVLERRSGLLRTATIPLLGHVIATLVTEGAVRVAIWDHAESRAAAWQLDTGISYVAITALSAALRYLPRRSRALGLSALSAIVFVPLIHDMNMTTWGHVLCVLIGMLSWHWLRTPTPAPARIQRPRWARLRWRIPWSAAALSGLTAAGLICLTSGSALLPSATPLGRPSAAARQHEHRQHQHRPHRAWHPLARHRVTIANSPMPPPAHQNAATT